MCLVIGVGRTGDINFKYIPSDTIPKPENYSPDVLEKYGPTFRSDQYMIEDLHWIR